MLRVALVARQRHELIAGHSNRKLRNRREDAALEGADRGRGGIDDEIRASGAGRYGRSGASGPSCRFISKKWAWVLRSHIGAAELG